MRVRTRAITGKRFSERLTTRVRMEDVYVPKGTFLISKTLELNAKTIMIGLGCKRSGRMPLAAIAAHPSWDRNESPALLRTVDDPDAETFLGGMDLVTTDKVGLHLHWRAGKLSTFMNLGFHGATSESTVYFSGNGGGRHYLVEPQSPAGTKEHRHVRIVGTSEPLSWYGCNLEAGGKVAANMEMVNAECPHLWDQAGGPIANADREGLPEHRSVREGALREALGKGSGGYIQIGGTSDRLLMPLILVQLVWGEPNGEPLLTEALDGRPKVSVTWPESISLYKRGELDDAVMRVDP